MPVSYCIWLLEKTNHNYFSFLLGYFLCYFRHTNFVIFRVFFFHLLDFLDLENFVIVFPCGLLFRCWKSQCSVNTTLCLGCVVVVQCYVTCLLVIGPKCAVFKSLSSVGSCFQSQSLCHCWKISHKESQYCYCIELTKWLFLYTQKHLNMFISTVPFSFHSYIADLCIV